MFDIESLKVCYNNIFDLNLKKVTFQLTQSYLILNLQKNCDVNKAARIDNSSGKFLRDGADSNFPKYFKVAKLKRLYNKGTKADP